MYGLLVQNTFRYERGTDVIGGTKRLSPEGVLSTPAFGHAYSDDQIAAVANYVTARFGANGSSLTARDVADLRAQRLGDYW